MTDAFSDYSTDITSSETTGSPTTTATQSTDSDGAVTELFTDAVRSNLDDADTINDDSRYTDPNSNRGADDVDPRSLYRKPTVNEIRYYSRQGPYGPTIISKPLRDAFRHGYEIPEDETGTLTAFLNEYEDWYIKADTKARRDGLAVLMHIIDDGADSAADPIPDSVRQAGDASFEGFTLWTIDNLSDDLTDQMVARHTEYDPDQIYVSEGPEHGGVAIVDDIDDPNYDTILGYGVEPREESVEPQSVRFVHADRCQQFVWNEHVDGDLGNNVTGEHVGESILTSVLEPLKATQMGFWALKNILYRYSAPLYAVEPPDTWGMDEWDEAEGNFENISMKSDALLPPGSSLTVADSDNEFDPEPFFDVLIEAICAGTVFTKSVLQGTQTGTVSGSETDVKGYFSEVQNLRQQRITARFREVASMVSLYDQSTVPRNIGQSAFEVEWGPLIKPTRIEQAEAAVSLVTATSNAIKNYELTPDEARSVLSEQWASVDIDVDLDPLTEDEMDTLDRINIREAGQGPQDDEPIDRENQMQQNGGGQPQGQTRERSQPQRADGLTDDAIDRIADRVVDQLQQ